MKRFFIILITICVAAPTVYSQTFTWSALGSGLNGTVYSIYTDASNIYYGGNYTINGSGYKGIAYWDGTSWSPVGHGISSLRDFPNDWSETVNCSVVSGGNLFVGGNFRDVLNSNDTYDEANGIAKWNGTSWVDIGSGISTGFVNPTTPTVYAILAIGSDIYIAGEFQSVNGTTVNSIAKWNGTTWSALGKGVTAGSQQLSSLATDGTYLYIGGNFTQVTNTDNSTVTVSNIARWNLSTLTWSSVGKGVDNGVSSMEVNNSYLYLVGGFTNATNSNDTNVSANGIIKWDGTSWSVVGDNSNIGTLSDIEFYGTDIYVAAAYWNGTSNEYKVTKWNGSSWAACGGNANSNINAIKVSSTYGAMFVGGNFSTVNGGTSASAAARFVDSSNPLPVELISFAANVNCSTVMLNWQTATEVNNYGFNVERRAKNEEWQKISFIQGHGNSNTPKSYSFTDNLAHNLDHLQYRLKQIDFDGKFEYSDIVEVNFPSPNKYELAQNFPNPFNPTTVIEFAIPKSGRYTLSIFNVLGELVEVISEKEYKAGYYKETFNAKELSSGIYFYRLKGDQTNLVRKMMLLR